MNEKNSKSSNEVAQPDNSIWTLLDAWEVPFRSTVAQLIMKYGATPDPTNPSFRKCILPAPTVFSGYTCQLYFDIATGTDDQSAPDSFIFLVNEANDPTKGHEFFSTILSTALGNGKSDDTSNARVTHWTDGVANISTTLFTSATVSLNCIATITPGWTPVLKSSENEALAKSDIIFNTDEFEVFQSSTPYSRVSKASTTKAGHCFSARINVKADLLFLTSKSGQALAIPPKEIKRFELIELSPAKGPGRSILKVHYQTGSQKTENWFVLTDCAHANAKALNKLANLLASTSGRPLSVVTAPDA